MFSNITSNPIRQAPAHTHKYVSNPPIFLSSLVADVFSRGVERIAVVGILINDFDWIWIWITILLFFRPFWIWILLDPDPNPNKLFGFGSGKTLDPF